MGNRKRKASGVKTGIERKNVCKTETVISGCNGVLKSSKCVEEVETKLLNGNGFEKLVSIDETVFDERLSGSSERLDSDGEGKVPVPERKRRNGELLELNNVHDLNSTPSCSSEPERKRHRSDVSSTVTRCSSPASTIESAYMHKKFRKTERDDIRSSPRALAILRALDMNAESSSELKNLEEKTENWIGVDGRYYLEERDRLSVMRMKVALRLAFLRQPVHEDILDELVQLRFKHLEQARTKILQELNDRSRRFWLVKLKAFSVNRNRYQDREVELKPSELEGEKLPIPWQFLIPRFRKEWKKLPSCFREKVLKEVAARKKLLMGQLSPKRKKRTLASMRSFNEDDERVGGELNEVIEQADMIVEGYLGSDLIRRKDEQEQIQSEFEKVEDETKKQHPELDSSSQLFHQHLKTNAKQLHTAGDILDETLQTIQSLVYIPPINSQPSTSCQPSLRTIPHSEAARLLPDKILCTAEFWSSDRYEKFKTAIEFGFDTEDAAEKTGTTHRQVVDCLNYVFRMTVDDDDIRLTRGPARKRKKPTSAVGQTSVDGQEKSEKSKREIWPDTKGLKDS